jgi:hypothetical protein
LNGEQGATGVEVESAVEVFLCHVSEVRPLDASGVRDDHIEVAALPADDLDHLVEIAGHRRIRGDRRDTSFNGNFRGVERLLPPTRDVDVSTFTCEPLGDRQTEARAPAGDEGYLVFKTHAFSLSHCCASRQASISVSTEKS